MKKKITPILNYAEQQLNYPICENVYEKENYKEDHLISEEDRT